MAFPPRVRTIRSIRSIRSIATSVVWPLVLLSASSAHAGKTDHAPLDYSRQAEWIAVHGERQSPIALDSASASSDADDSRHNAITTATTVVHAVVSDNVAAPAVQVDIAPGNIASIRGRRFQLVQFHFHTPAEHTIDGVRFPLEAHFVYKASNGKLAVIGVMLAEGASNPALTEVMRRLTPGSAAATPGEIDIAPLMPTNKSYFHYLGSLTTPPLTQNVEWYVLSHARTISPAQLVALQRRHVRNNRDLQPSNGREVLFHLEP